MPCMCWISEDKVSKELNEMRNHLKEAVRLAKLIHRKGDLPPISGLAHDASQSVDLYKTLHLLIDDYWNGKCSETGEKL